MRTVNHSSLNGPMPIFFLLLSLMLMGPSFLFSHAVENTKSGQTSFVEKDQKRKEQPPSSTAIGISIEFYGGFSPHQLGDLNSLIEYDKQIQNFFYDAQYQYRLDLGAIDNWQKYEANSLKKLKNMFPYGVRIKYHLNDLISLSAGVKIQSRSYLSDFAYEYRYSEEQNRYSYLDGRDYQPYSLSVKAVSPMLGIHLEKKVRDNLGLEVFAAAGPLYAECLYSVKWESDWEFIGDGYVYPLFEQSGSLEQQGKGTGLSADLGGRINFFVKPDLGVFIEGAYSFLKVHSLSGTGSETRDDQTANWEGRWGIKEENLHSPWGSLTLQVPTNYWENWTAEQKIKDFSLDLSGIQLRIGLQVRF